MTRQELIEYLNTLTSYCIDDANTYLWAKCQSDFKNAEQVGGGNFIVLLATFSFLDLLSYLNGLLDNKPQYTESEISDINRKNLGCKPRVGDLKINGTDLFTNLINETAEQTGIKNDKDITLLRKIRHKLTHEFNPKFLPAASYGMMPGENFYELIKAVEKRQVFTTSESMQGCIDVHAFNHKLRKITNHLLSKIEKADESTIEKTSNWINNN